MKRTASVPILGMTVTMRLKSVRKMGIGLFLLMMLLLFTIAATTLINPAAAFLQSLPTITIHSDGAIEPKTDYIRRDGNVYTLTADIIREYAIRIQCSNIIFDGKGHTINGSQSSYFGYANIGLTLDKVSNVIIKNIKISGFGMVDIYLNASSQCSVLNADVGFLYIAEGSGNTIAGNTIGRLNLESTEKNTITKNSINGLLLVENSNHTLFTKNNINSIFFRDNNDGNTFYLNNFWRGKGDPEALHFFEYIGTNYWDNGSVGNYWFDYDGKDANLDGIGDTPYFIKTKVYDETIDTVVERTIAKDNHPLINPYDIENDSLILLPVNLYLTVIAAGIISASASLIIYFKKYKRQAKSFSIFLEKVKIRI
ncbi:MAG: NosD domain-containing protein [Candidatus Bathyarchaeia archaeon]